MTCLRPLVSGLLDRWSTPGVRGMEGDSACGLKAATWEGMGASAPLDLALASEGWSEITLLTERAEKNPAP